MRSWALACVLAASLVASGAQALVWPDVPERIERGLESTDVGTRRAASRELATLSAERARPLVLRALEDPDDDVKRASADAAIRLRIAEATNAVLPWLSAGSPELRRSACSVARALPDSRAVPALARALGDTEATVRAAAADALGSYGGDASAVPPLLGRLDDGSPNVRSTIARSLARLDDARAVIPLVGLVQDSVTEVRQSVVRALGDLGDARAGQALLLPLRDSAVEVRVDALAALGKLRAGSAVDAIAPLAADRNPSIRQSAIAALGRIASPSAVRALVADLGTGDDAEGGFERTPVRDALVAAGVKAVPEVASVLERPSGSAAAAASAAWVLGELRARDRAATIVTAMRGGWLPSPAALHALAGAGTSASSLPVVLEFVNDPSRTVREQALAAASALLDPASPDGRAVEPLAEALARNVHLASDERAAIAQLLGRTGAARAAPFLAGLARGGEAPSTGSPARAHESSSAVAGAGRGARRTENAVRLAAIDALGTLGPVAATRSEDVTPLADALDDSDPVVRVHAAVALSQCGDARARDALVAKLDDAEVDRSAVLTALGGIVARIPSDASVAALTRALDLAAGDDRDAVAVALGRAQPSRAAMEALTKLAASDDPDDRRTCATLLAAHTTGEDAARAAALARSLLSDPDPSVRAQAAWALGALGDRTSGAMLAPLLRGQSDVAVNASSALGRISARAHEPSIAFPLCASFDDERAAVRAAALAGLSLAHARCGDGAHERHMLDADPDDTVRAAAALAVARTPNSDLDVRALARCVATDRSGDVASRCRAPAATSERTQAVDVYAVPDLASRPVPHTPYLLVLADGALHAGIADRRGAVFDPRAPEGELRLLRAR